MYTNSTVVKEETKINKMCQGKGFHTRKLMIHLDCDYNPVSGSFYHAGMGTQSCQSFKVSEKLEIQIFM